MLDMTDRSYQSFSDRAAASKPHACSCHSPWLKAGAVAIAGGSSFVLLSLLISSSSSPTFDSKSTADSSSLFGRLSSPKGPTTLRISQAAARPRLLPPQGRENAFRGAAAEAEYAEEALEHRLQTAHAAADEGPPSIARRILCAAPATSAILALCSWWSQPSTAAMQVRPPVDKGLLIDPAKQYYAQFNVRSLTGGKSGIFRIKVHPEWAPESARRFADLMERGFYDNLRFYHVNGSVAEFGLTVEPASRLEHYKAHTDDLRKEANSRGRLSFAPNGRDESRNTQIFVNLKDNADLDDMGFAPFAEIIDGMSVVDQLYSGYGDSGGPNQLEIEMRGKRYLSQFDQLSFITFTDVSQG